MSIIIQPRSRLYGRKATDEEIAREIARLYLGDQLKRLEPCNISEICKTLGYNSRSTIYSYLEKACLMGLLEKDGTTHRYKKPEKTNQEEFQEFNENHKITQDPLVSNWIQDLMTRKGGNPIISAQNRIVLIERICNNLKIMPRQLLVSQNNTEKLIRNYLQMCQQGKVFGKNKKTPLSATIESAQYTMTQAVADFCGYHEMIWKRGVGGVMSRKIPNHGKYADKRLTDEELQRADQYIKLKWGLDSDVYRWFWIGIESCSRFTSLYTMSLEYTIHTSSKTGKTTYIMTAYESKTKHIKGGRWIKYITRPDTQKSIDLLRSRGGTRIYEEFYAKDTMSKKMHEKLREVYQHVGKTEYFKDHPTHALRHIGAHFWLNKKDYNYGLVSVIGGWNTIDELKKSYGEIPPEKVLEMVEEENDKTRENSLLYL